MTTKPQLFTFYFHFFFLFLPAALPSWCISHLHHAEMCLRSFGPSHKRVRSHFLLVMSGQVLSLHKSSKLGLESTWVLISGSNLLYLPVWLTHIRSAVVSNMQPYLCNMTIVFPQESVDICRFSSASTSAPMASSLAHTPRVCHSVWVCNEVAAAVLEYKWKLTQKSTEKHENESWGWWWADCQCCTLLQSTVQSEEIQILVISSLLTRIALSLSQDGCCSVLDIF